MVVSARSGLFKVNCTSTGGRALTMSVSGPSCFNFNLKKIKNINIINQMGNDNFSATSNAISGRSNGDIFQCIASNGVSSDPTNVVELKGNLLSPTYDQISVSLLFSSCPSSQHNIGRKSSY